MRAPPVGILLLIFIGKHGFKGPTMQVEGYHIGGSERILRQLGEKEFVDHALARVTDTALFRGHRMSGHHHTAAQALWPERYIGTVVELALPSHFPHG
jgi:hypothetical protein